jgi:hypothetical protein
VLRTPPQDEEDSCLALKAYLILRRPQSGRLEGRTALIQPTLMTGRLRPLRRLR